MIRRQFVRKRYDEAAKIDVERDTGLTRSLALPKDQERLCMERPSILKNRQQTVIYGAKFFNRTKFQTQPIQFCHDQAKNEESIQRILAQGLDSSFLPMIEEGRNYYQKRKNSEENNDWVDKLKAKHEIKRIYAEERQKLAKDLECWSRVQARLNIIRQIKREKLRLIALYQKQ